MIDIRPRVSDFTNSENSRSPLEFLGRTYDGDGNSAANILASDESINVDYSFYLGRVDRIFITKDGRLQVQQGTPSETYERPVPIDDALEIASVKLEPYLIEPEFAKISFLDHKRYRMSDIKRLEDRIKSLEYYTTLSLLEVGAESLFVTDSEDSTDLNLVSLLMTLLLFFHKKQMFPSRTLLILKIENCVQDIIPIQLI